MEKYSALDLFLETELRHTYKSEQKVYDNLQEMAEKAKSPQLREVFLHHSRETQTQIKRLDRIFNSLEIDIHQSKVLAFPS
jgi:ferritin-like metal-binding protein YciE